MLAWTDVSNHIAQARNYWVGTVDADGQPHAVPIWAIWIETTLFFDGAPQVRWVRNLAANPKVVVHLESGDKVVILEGSVVRLPHLDPRVLPMVAAASEAKYGGTFKDRGCLALHPQVVYAWTSFPADATASAGGRIERRRHHQRVEALAPCSADNVTSRSTTPLAGAL